MFSLFHGDCLKIASTFEDKSVDAIITDLPYGTTKAEWDVVIPFKPMWQMVKRVLKPGGVFITTASQPFSSDLINSNRNFFRYELIWAKSSPSGYFNARRFPMKIHENILIFSDGYTTYNPQMTYGKKYTSRVMEGLRKSKLYGNETVSSYVYESKGKKFPVSILFFSKIKGKHSTQKPISLYEYLILTYTNEQETILDFVMGSGTTGVAAMQTGRRFIGCEIDLAYFEIAEKRIKKASLQPSLFTPSNNSVNNDSANALENLG